MAGAGAPLIGAAAGPTLFNVGIGMGAVGGWAVGEMMKPPKVPKMPKPTPGTMQVSAEYASEAEKQRRRRRKGYGSTMLSGGELGVASTQRKQILGVGG